MLVTFSAYKSDIGRLWEPPFAETSPVKDTSLHPSNPPRPTTAGRGAVNGLGSAVLVNDAGLLAVSALVAASAANTRKCRERMLAAVERLEGHAPGTARGDRLATDAAMCLRTACVACARCPGI